MTRGRATEGPHAGLQKEIGGALFKIGERGWGATGVGFQRKRSGEGRKKNYNAGGGWGKEET